MPYLTQDAREKLDSHINDILEVLLETNVSVPGGLNYAICRVADGVIAAKGESYSIYNTLLGATEAAKLEIYRRMVAPYEDAKCKENGEVFSSKTPNKDEGQQKLFHLGQPHGGA
jgi:hypothetical protein